jgi:hypothetical protein
MAIAESCGGEYGLVKEKLSLLMKYQKPESSDDSAVKKVEEEILLTSPKDTKAMSRLTEKLEKEKEKLKGKAVPMFPKPGAMFYSCEQLNKANHFRKEHSLSTDWVLEMIKRLIKSQELVRTDKADPDVVLHNILFLFSHEETANCHNGD